ncbi:MAG: hypothetical protein ACW96U_00655 [Candidatus Heimdallarchaeaceae archaeon]|jgi:hypothetical protein
MKKIKINIEVKMKQFMVFAWWDYEACGGMNDFKDSFDTYQEALDYVESITEYNYDWRYDRAEIINKRTMKRIEK